MSNDDARQARVERAAEVINRSLVRQVHDEVVEIIADEGLEVERTVARALDDAGMLADPAGQDADECPKCGCPTRCAEGELAKAWNIVRRQERTIEGYERSAVNADELRRRAERAEAELADYRAADCFGTSCLSCARTLESAAQETARAERAEATLERVRAYLVTEQHSRCAYGTAEGDGRTCDCKSIDLMGRRSSEQTGCVEMRRAIWALDGKSDA